MNPRKKIFHVSIHPWLPRLCVCASPTDHAHLHKFPALNFLANKRAPAVSLATVNPPVLKPSAEHPGGYSVKRILLSAIAQRLQG